MNAQNQILVGTHSTHLTRRVHAASHSLRRVAAPLLAAALALLPAAAQAQAIEAWVQRYDGPGNGDDSAYAMAVDTNGNVYVTGSSTAANGQGCTTIKYSSTGTGLWTNRYSPGTAGSALAVDASGNVVVTAAGG